MASDEPRRAMDEATTMAHMADAAHDPPPVLPPGPPPSEPPPVPKAGPAALPLAVVVKPSGPSP